MKGRMNEGGFYHDGEHESGIFSGIRLREEGKGGVAVRRASMPCDVGCLTGVYAMCQRKVDGRSYSERLERTRVVVPRLEAADIESQWWLVGFEWTVSNRVTPGGWYLRQTCGDSRISREKTSVNEEGE